MSFETDHESRRILAEYERRSRAIPADFYALSKPANLFTRQGQERWLLHILRKADLLPLGDRKVLEVGCGRGNWFSAFEAFGADLQQIAGIELDPTRAAACQARFPSADVRIGDARTMPWDDESFDIVFQSTVFTSILDEQARREMAAEMLRVLHPSGCIVWYDFIFNNPHNPNVKGIDLPTIKSLFPECPCRFWRVTLAPPLSRRIVPLSWWLADLMERCKLLNTHYFGYLRKLPKQDH
jgi:SAM-dependent methyltransferase